MGTSAPLVAFAWKQSDSQGEVKRYSWQDADERGKYERPRRGVYVKLRNKSPGEINNKDIKGNCETSNRSLKGFKVSWFVSLSTSCSSLTSCSRHREPLTSFIWPHAATSGLPQNHTSRQISCCYNWQRITRSKLQTGLCNKTAFLWMAWENILLRHVSTLFFHYCFVKRYHIAKHALWGFQVTTRVSLSATLIHLSVTNEMSCVLLSCKPCMSALSFIFI